MTKIIVVFLLLYAPAIWGEKLDLCLGMSALGPGRMSPAAMIAFQGLDQLIPGETTYHSNLTENQFHYFEGYRRTLKLGGKQTVLGQIMIRYTKETGKLLIADMKVSEKRIGIGKLLLIRALIQYPNSKSIVSDLGLDNYKVFEQFNKKYHSVIKALRETPAYKMRKLLGYTEIDEKTIDIDDETESIHFSVRKP